MEYLNYIQLGLTGFMLIILVAMLFQLIGKGRGNDGGRIEMQLIQLEKTLERHERLIREELGRNREDAYLVAKQNREETGNSVQNLAELLMSRMTNIATIQNNQLDSFANRLMELTQMNEQKLESIRGTVESKLQTMQRENEQKLEQMRLTVDEKLNATLEQRLGESFKLVSDRLERVHQGLGEMQNLAAGVGDLKKVLTNVKTRGNWGEVQLSQLLEQMLTVDQYAANVAPNPESGDRVEFALKIPSRDQEKSVIWLPIDAKFPLEDYQRLIEAQERGYGEEIEMHGRALEQRIKGEAKSIREKYLNPPHTTDFGILFLPVEGLYAEVLRRPGLFDLIQREYRVVISGPTTISAFLSSLQMGFKTLAIERRSSEVWALLGAVKSEFGKFSTLLEKTQKKLYEASASIENAAKKTRTIERKLKDVQEISFGEHETEEITAPLQLDEDAV